MATAKDIVEFYGRRPPQTIRAIVVFINGSPEGLAGIARDGEITRFFSDHNEALKPHLKKLPVLRAIKAVQKMLSEYPSVVLAEAEHETGAKLLRRLGFSYMGKGYFAWLH